MRIAAFALALAGAALSLPAVAQTNNGDATPLGSRIRRDQQIERDLAERFTPGQMQRVNGKRRDNQLTHFAKCIYDRSHENAASLIARTDYGFDNPAQIGSTFDQLAQNHGFNDCLSRVARNSQRGTRLAMRTGNLRAMLLQQAYFDRYPDRPTWWQAGYAPTTREYPISSQNPGVAVAMDFADCIVMANPASANFFYRAPEESDEEKEAIRTLQSNLGPCLTDGQSLELTPYSLRVMLGEALWHAATTSRPVQTSEEVQ